MSAGRRVLVICFDPVGAAMAGPAIRSWHLAGELARAGHVVTLATTVAPGPGGLAAAGPAPAGVAVVHADGADLDRLAGASEVVVAPTSVCRRHPGVVATGVPLAIDLSIPTHLENLRVAGRGPETHAADVDHQVSVIADDLAQGDWYFCASERQRDFWLGALASAGRVNPATTAADPGLRSLIDVVPFGLPERPPEPGDHPLRRALGIPLDAEVAVWGGGVYDWLDPLTAVRAVDRLASSRPDLHLAFYGMRNPNPGLPEPAVAGALRELVASLGPVGERIHLHPDWLPYHERGAWLLDADVAVSTHGDHLETRFSFRTRVLDYLWAARPMVLTGGDDLSSVVETAGLGVAVPAGDPDAVAAGLDRMLSDPPPPAAFGAVADRFRWATVAAPLVAWCGAGRPAADRRGPMAGAASLAGMPADTAPPARPSLAEAEARAERIAPGYLATVRDAARRLAVGPDRRGDLRASLEGLTESASVDVDVPTRSRQAPVRLVKTGVKKLTGFYVRYLGQQVSALGHATASFGAEVADRTDDLEAQLAAATARIAELEARLARLDGGAGAPVEDSGP